MNTENTPELNQPHAPSDHSGVNKLTSVELTSADHLNNLARIAKLAKLQPQPEDLKLLAKNLDAMMDLVAQLQAAETQGLEPMAHPLEQIQQMRADLVTEADQRQQLQAVAPSGAVTAGFYLVPVVL